MDVSDKRDGIAGVCGDIGLPGDDPLEYREGLCCDIRLVAARGVVLKIVDCTSESLSAACDSRSL